MKTLEGIVAVLGAHRVLLLGVLGGLLLLLLPVAVAIYRRRKRAPVAASPQVEAPPQPGEDRLHAAWQRFMKGLPRDYQQSVLDFDHFVVMGAAGSGKTQLIDDHADWRWQTKVIASRPDDPDLPVYVASGKVIVELPARALEGPGEAVYPALGRLWRPIYEKRGPTVVCVVDLARLGESPPDLVVDLAGKMRGAINVLSTIRGRPIEVRVALTHLDQLDGYQELASFCRDHEIPLWVAPPAALEQGEIGRGLDAWLDDLRGYLPNALISLESAKFRRVVSFLSRAPDISSVMRPFLGALFQRDAVAAEPICGGVYLASRTPGVSYPLQDALESGPRPHSRRRHLVVAAAFGILGAGFLGVGFHAQYTRWSAASESLAVYSVGDRSDDEPSRRADVVAFTSRNSGWWDRHPDFFGDARHEMRKRFSERIREHYLIKGLRTVAETGTRRAGGTPMAARRSVYFLGLIHSDKSDKLDILEQTEIWASMIELRRETSFLSDYLANVDEAYRTPIAFQLTHEGIDPLDGSREWVALLDAVDRALADGVLSGGELSELQRMTRALRGRIDRFDHDAVMRRALHDLPGPLERNYHFMLETFERQVAWAADPDLPRTLQRVLEWVNASAIDVAPPHSLGDLVFRLEQLYDAHSAPATTNDSQVSVVRIEGKEWKLPTGRWEQIIRDGKAEQYIEGFLSHAIDQGIFFPSDVERSLAPVVWNANGETALLFPGRGVLDGRYTQAAYDKYVGSMAVRLTAVLARSQISADLRAALDITIRDQIARYAARYREELLRFIQAFDVQVRSTEDLRAVLAQINDFLVAVDQNAHLDAPVPLLSPIRAELASFEPWHTFVDGGNAPAIGRYKSMLGQILLDLGASDEVLSPVARHHLPQVRAELRGGSYDRVLESWLTSLRVPEAQRKPFRAPLRDLASHLDRAKRESALVSSGKASKPNAVAELPALRW